MARNLLFLLNGYGYGYDYDDYPGYGYGGDDGYYGGSAGNSGLYLSAKFVVDMLNASGIPSTMATVRGLDEIDRVISEVRPTDCVVEALFIAPSELGWLTSKYTDVRWFVRIHSNAPFLAQEGNSTEWLWAYLALPSVNVAANTQRGTDDLKIVVHGYFPHWKWPTLARRVPLLPNYYPTPAPLPRMPPEFGLLNVGCMGALRILKNHMQQAFAAIGLAAAQKKRLQFHVNGTRLEASAPSVLTNLRNLFAHTENAALTEHVWMARDDFLDLTRQMDLALQVSMSETFNITSADFVTNNVPIVVSSEVEWSDQRIHAHPTSGTDIMAKAALALQDGSITESNRRRLLLSNDRSRAAWLLVFGAAADRWTDAPDSWPALRVITGDRDGA